MTLAGHRMPGRRRRPHRGATVVRALLAGCGVALLTAGCSAVRSDLGTANAPCYVALPAAARAVHHHGRLVGVRIEATTALRRTPLTVRSMSPGGPPVRRVCLVAYVGRYTMVDVESPRGRPAGRYAVVDLAYPSTRLLATVLLHHLPIEFGHAHIGPS
jgi:hypothetical protein